ncbi:PglL family O-oligosaccharyltransferase [Undibacterium flavidum]|uniref:O-antigen ligase C-terminal domain-containing protein n=1 Tax=Undibacterium flavidum TaxID=2762297 RepID=A0ABR6YBD8_9BURK|nr:O-antigen ligase family protein [Undibacterium flavidum]MBC3873949.1 O-antigen ligase C-terminal domain-containing protein [Undibacterium flavidum]
MLSSLHQQHLSLKLTGMLAACMFSLPFVLPWHSMPIPSFYSEVLAMFFGLLAALTLLVWTIRQKQANSAPVIILLPFCFLLVIAAQWIGGYFSYGSKALIIAAYLVWMGIVIWTGHTLAKYDDDAKINFDSIHLIAGFLALAGVINALFGIVQYVGIPPVLQTMINPRLAPGAGVFGNIAQQNHFASYLTLSLCSILYLYQQARLGLRWALLIASILILAMILSASRSVYLYGVWLAFVFVVGSKLGRFKFHFSWRISLLVTVSILVTLALLIKLDVPQLHRYWQFSETIGARVYLWQHAWQMFVNYPVLGVGFDAFAYQLIQQLAQAGVVNQWGIDQYAHNLILQVLAVSGIVGFVSLMLPLISLAWTQRKFQHTSRRRYIFACMGILAIHSMLEQPLYYAYFLGIAAFFLGYVDVRSVRLPVAKIFQIGCVLVLLCLIAFMSKTSLDFYCIEQGLFAIEETHGMENSTSREALIQSLNQRSLFQAELEAYSPSSFVSVQASVKQKLDLNTRLLRTAPVEEVVYRQASLLAENGQIAEAKQQLRAAMLAYPAAIDTYLPRFIWLGQNDANTYQELAQFAEQEAASYKRKQP